MKNVPRLRFKGFSDEWKKKHFNEIAERVVRKNKGNITKRPLTISAQYGLIDQEEFFNKVVASKNMEGYYLLNNGEFAYNKSYSNGYPFGAIKRLEKYENGAVSTLYICFKNIKNTNADFLAQYFESDKWYKEVSMIAVEGARNHGLLNISVTDFFDTIHAIPSLEEQEKISNFLAKVDKLIEKQEEKVNNLEQYKKGMMQKIFSQEIRFKKEDGGEYPKWNLKKIGVITKLTDGVHFTPEYVEEGVPFWSVETIVSGVKPKYITEEAHKLAIKRCHPEKNDILITRIGTLAKSVVLTKDEELSIYVSVALIKSSNKFNSIYLKQYFDSEEYYKEFLSKSLLTATPKKINMEDLKDTRIKLPCLEEQTKIANFLSKIDSIVDKEKEKLEELRQWKKGLLQQMFV